jgi:hypothetical protein
MKSFLLRKAFLNARKQLDTQAHTPLLNEEDIVKLLANAPLKEHSPQRVYFWQHFTNFLGDVKPHRVQIAFAFSICAVLGSIFLYQFMHQERTTLLEIKNNEAPMQQVFSMENTKQEMHPQNRINSRQNAFLEQMYHVKSVKKSRPNFSRKKTIGVVQEPQYSSLQPLQNAALGMNTLAYAPEKTLLEGEKTMREFNAVLREITLIY